MASRNRCFRGGGVKKMPCDFSYIYILYFIFSLFFVLTSVLQEQPDYCFIVQSVTRGKDKTRNKIHIHSDPPDDIWRLCQFSVSELKFVNLHLLLLKNVWRSGAAALHHCFIICNIRVHVVKLKHRVLKSVVNFVLFLRTLSCTSSLHQVSSLRPRSCADVAPPCYFPDELTLQLPGFSH